MSLWQSGKEFTQRCTAASLLSRAELDSRRVPLDLNALIPIPRRVLRKGFVEAGQEWMWANWGVRWPIRRVTFAIKRKRRDTSGVKPVAVFRFLRENWSPWIALLHMRKRWPELRFEMKAGILILSRLEESECCKYSRLIQTVS